jgi:hypothetical protein
MQLTIHLPATTAIELQRRAHSERRRPRDEAAIILERELTRQLQEQEQKEKEAAS